MLRSASAALLVMAVGSQLGCSSEAFLLNAGTVCHRRSPVRDSSAMRLRDGLSRSELSTRGRATRAALSESLKSTLVHSSERAKTLPWKESVAGAEHKLLYMPFLEWQLDFMKKNFPDMKDLPFEEHLSKQTSTKKPAVIESWQYETKEFRKIRLTYIDAGQNAQVFNSVWYPRHTYDAPVFGIDFLAFGKKKVTIQAALAPHVLKIAKVLAILDLQPLTQDPAYLEKYIDPLVPLRNKYEELCGRMSSKFYDETRFFSKQLLFGRFDNDEPVMKSLFPAFQEYMEYYLKMIRELTPNDSNDFTSHVAELQREYDQYSAEKDPAVGLFSTYWGENWAEDFTYNFLFSEAVPQPKPAETKAE